MKTIYGWFRIAIYDITWYLIIAISQENFVKINQRYEKILPSVPWSSTNFEPSQLGQISCDLELYIKVQIGLLPLD